jgi:hypothetical protein
MLAVSKDLIHWQSLKTLLYDDTGLEPEQSAYLTGFQYPDWQFDGEDIIYLVRTAYRGAHTFHDSNRITYHVLKDFRSLIKTEFLLKQTKKEAQPGGKMKNSTVKPRKAAIMNTAKI